MELVINPFVNVNVYGIEISLAIFSHYRKKPGQFVTVSILQLNSRYTFFSILFFEGTGPVILPFSPVNGS